MATFVYILQSNGALKVKTTFLPDTSAVTSLARVGLAFEMPYAITRFLIWDVVNMKLI